MATTDNQEPLELFFSMDFNFIFVHTFMWHFLFGPLRTETPSEGIFKCTHLSPYHGFIFLTHTNLRESTLKNQIIRHLKPVFGKKIKRKKLLKVGQL